MKNPIIGLSNLKVFLDNLKIEIQKAEDKAKAFATEKTGESNTQLLGKLTDLKAELTQSISTIAQAYTDNKIADAKSDAIQYTDTKTQAMKNDIVNSIPTTITTEINQSISGGAIKAMKDAMMTDYKQYVDNSQNAQNTAIDTKLNDLKATLQNYSDHNISELVGGSPEVLNTLYELSNALGNDPNFSSTITTLIGQKLNTSDTTTSVEANKVLRLDENGHIPAAILAASGASTGGGTPSGGTGLTPAEKLKLDGIEEGANKYIHPATHPASMIMEEVDHRWFTDEERTKLAGIEAAANNYVHPTSHPATMIEESNDKMFISKAEKDRWNNLNTSIQVTLLSSAWTDRKCVVRSASIKKDALIILSLPVGTSNAVRTMINAANIQCTKQEDGMIELEATTVPTFDVNIILTITLLNVSSETIQSSAS
jgi:phage pre-neck appendage-like protein|nr:MAG TPA: hypothetical protein [Caudoviricetes sp.]